MPRKSLFRVLDGCRNLVNMIVHGFYWEIPLIPIPIPRYFAIAVRVCLVCLVIMYLFVCYCSFFMNGILLRKKLNESAHKQALIVSILHLFVMSSQTVIRSFAQWIYERRAQNIMFPTLRHQLSTTHSALFLLIIALCKMCKIW